MTPSRLINHFLHSRHHTDYALNLTHSRSFTLTRLIKQFLQTRRQYIMLSLSQFLYALYLTSFSLHSHTNHALISFLLFFIMFGFHIKVGTL